MADRVITLRIPEDVAAQLDAYRQGLLDREGLEVSQHEAILSLIRVALNPAPPTADPSHHTRG